MIFRENPNPPRINPNTPILIQILHFHNLRILRESQLIHIFFPREAGPGRKVLHSRRELRRWRDSGGRIVFEPPSTYRIPDCETRRAVVGVADDCHAVGLQTSAPATRAVYTRNFAVGDEGVVAGIANIVVAGFAFVAVETGCGVRDLGFADVAERLDGFEEVAVRFEVREREEGELARVVGRVPVAAGGDVGEREERVRAVLALHDAGVAVAPCALQADFAVPVGVVCVGEAAFAERAFLEESVWVWSGGLVG